MKGGSVGKGGGRQVDKEGLAVQSRAGPTWHGSLSGHRCAREPQEVKLEVV